MIKARKEKFLFFTFLFLSLMFFLSAAGCENENLLTNGDFEILDGDGLPEGWFTDAYRMDPGYSVYKITEGMDGADSNAATINNTAKNDARFAQIVSVKPETVYCLSGYIRAEAVEEGHGANLSVEGVYAFSEKVYETEGEWQYIEYYGETGPDQYTVTVFARVGGYSGESKGTASFDHLTLKEVTEIPEDVFPDLWFHYDSYSDEEDEEEWDDGAEEKKTAPAWPWLIVIGLIYVILATGYLYTHRKEESLLSENPWRSGASLFVLAAALALV